MSATEKKNDTGTGNSTKEETASVNPSLLPLQATNNEIIPVTRFPPLSVFDKATTYPAVIIPARRTADLRNSLKGALLHLPKIKNVYPNPDNSQTRKLVLSGEDALKDERVAALLQEDCCRKSSQVISKSYSDRNVDEILRQILPSSIPELPAAFEIVGSIAHLNLRDGLLPYKYLVGKVILDKNRPRIQTVVNKLGSIANEYRTFGMEVIAGVDKPNWSLVKVKEEGCEFTLDFQQVYWNSRLGFEHNRLVTEIQTDARQRKEPTIVADLMAGVGPFAVPLTAVFPPNKNHNKKNKKQKGKKRAQHESITNTDANSGDKTEINKATIIVHANDLNPASYKYLKINGQKNKCPSNRMISYNMDARAFCHQLQTESIEFHHVVMNLPASAPEFLDAFQGFTNTTIPRIHVYCFAPKPEEEDPKGYEQEVFQRCATALGCELEESKHEATIRIVRDVSPRKNMVCVSFFLPEEVRKLPRIAVEARIGGNGEEKQGEERQPDENEGSGEPKQKRCKTSGE